MKGLNESFQDFILPLIAIFILYDIVGFLGNLIVLFVYTFRYKRNRFRCLVLALSVIDFISCCTTVPMETVSTWMWFHAPSRHLCKAKNFFVQFTASSAMYMLFVTGVFKYQQICKPFGRQTSQNGIVITCVGGFAVALIFATPAAFLWDINNHTTTYNNMSEIIYICEVHISFHKTLYPALYRHCLSGYAIFLLASIILYLFVARTTVRHFRRLKRKPSSNVVFDNRAVSIEDDAEQSSGDDNNVLKTGEASLNPPLSSENSKETIDLSFTRSARLSIYKIPSALSLVDTDRNRTTTIPSKPSPACSGLRRSQLTPERVRKVAIMVIIAWAFAITFFMALAFGYVFAIQSFEDFDSIADLVVLFCCYRVYFINYALNPFIYLILDGRFRLEVIKLLTCREA